MPFTWDLKNNFILIHSVIHHQQQSGVKIIDWACVVNDIQLEILSTPVQLECQYDYLSKTFDSKQDSMALYLRMKTVYLQSLCKKMEESVQNTLQTAYELIRHARSKRISAQDIEQLIKEWKSNFSSDEEQPNKQHLLKILNRIVHYIKTVPNDAPHFKQIQYSNINQSTRVDKLIRDENRESLSDSKDEPAVIEKQSSSTATSNREKPLLTRRRTQSLTISVENKDDQVNVGVEWFVPKYKRQQRSSSIHTEYPLISSAAAAASSSVENQQLLTTIDNDESSNSTNPSHVQSPLSCLSHADDQITEEERRQTDLKLIDDQQLDDVSSTDSESIQIQWSSSAKNKLPPSSMSHQVDDDHQENNSSKRQRLA
ncbi:unnamed protein product [Adineta ricciae]|uniref:Uncharacterized protein n=1 Tax=Adineta ricciae TaxID=249248 RepID=A0A814DPZ4_ADIRI|nr:unnamed protein product [Adineta ricciae]CAF0960109.1 unnamed protein product [Adineta ricciae]